MTEPPVNTYPADPLPLDVSVLRGLIRAGLTVKGIYDSIPRKGPTCSGMRERSAGRAVFLPVLPLPLGFTSVGFYDALPGFDLSDQCGKAWISTKGFQIAVLSHAGSSVGGPTVLNGVAQDRQGLVATTAQGCVAGEVVLGAGGDGMIGAENAALRIDCFSIEIGGFGVTMKFVQRDGQLLHRAQSVGMSGPQRSLADCHCLAESFFGFVAMAGCAQDYGKIVDGPLGVL